MLVNGPSETASKYGLSRAGVFQYGKITPEYERKCPVPPVVRLTLFLGTMYLCLGTTADSLICPTLKYTLRHSPILT